MDRHRYRVVFGKTDALRFTGHLDLHRAWERTLRRADVEIAFTEGYRPRARINIGAALPLGSTSENDLVDIELEESPDPDELMARLQAAAPPGLEIHSITSIGIDAPKLQKLIESSEYSVQMPPGEAAELAPRIGVVLAASELPRVRRDKSYDLRPLIEALWLDGEALRFRLAARDSATGRPDELLLALELDPHQYHAVRTRLILKSNQSGTSK